MEKLFFETEGGVVASIEETDDDGKKQQLSFASQLKYLNSNRKLRRSDYYRKKNTVQ